MTRLVCQFRIQRPKKDTGCMKSTVGLGFPVRQEHRPRFMDAEAQFYRTHGNAKVKSKWGLDITPSEELPNTRILAVRTYCDVEAAIQTLVYFNRWGHHRCNICADTNLGPGVYCYPDIKCILENRDLGVANNRRYVIGVISGYLLKADNAKRIISLDSRNCTLGWIFCAY